MRYIFSAILLLVLLFTPNDIQAQSSIDLEASVGRYSFSASGIASPYASIVMTSQDFFLSSTAANEDGEFILPAAIVNDGFNEFCLEVHDIRRIGVSYTCFEAEPPTRDYARDGIFLPPTVGLSGRKIEPNSPILASGYTMPGSSVDINITDEIKIETTANQDGFYKAEIASSVAPEGKYELYATAVYGAKTSEKPTRTFTIEILGFLGSIPMWLWIVILLLIFIFIFFLFFIFWKRRRKKKEKQVAKNKSSRFQKLFFWRT